MAPIISVLCQAYNHGEFIEQCLNGIMMQETDFSFEVLIHDDASTDNTADIIRGFELRFPGIVKPIYQTVNQFSQNKKVFSRIQLPRANGKYVAICEGDDYWTDPFKLQKQVDFLEANEDFAISHHNVKVIYENSDEEYHLSNPLNQKEVSTIKDLAHGNFIITASCVFRTKLFEEFPEWFSKCPVVDYPLHMLNAQFGKIKFFPDVMGVYRVHKGGVWQNKSLVYRSIKHLEMLEQMKYHFIPEINRILVEAQNRNAEFLVTHFKENPESCKYYSLLLLENNPHYIANLLQNIQLLTNNIDIKNQEIDQQNAFLGHKDKVITQLTSLLDQKGAEEKRLKSHPEIINEAFFQYKQKSNHFNLKISSLKLNWYSGLKKVFEVLLNSLKLGELVKTIINKIRNKKIEGLIRQSKLFDEYYYLKNNPDIKILEMRAITHYLMLGGFEGRNPSEKFQSEFYLEQNPDVIKSGMNPLVHYLKYGKKENREIGNF